MIALRPLLIGVVLGVVVMLAVQAWRDNQPSTPAVPATDARELRNETTTVVACKPIVVYRDKVKAELGLPPDVQANPARQVVAATKVPASDRPHTVSAVADLGTGKVDLFVRPDPLPWLALERRTSVSVIYGVDNEGAQRLRGVAQVDLLRSRNWHLGAAAHVDANGRVLAGVVLSFR